MADKINFLIALFRYFEYLPNYENAKSIVENCPDSNITLTKEEYKKVQERYNVKPKR